jgi:large subunit ribosomal protein L13
MNQASTKPSYKTPLEHNPDVEWFVVDAADQVLGRLATRIAHVVQGKSSANYSRNIDGGQRVVVINAEKIKLTGKKLQNKKYYRYTGWIGGLKETTAEKMLETKPEQIIERAVRGMLPKTNLGRQLLKNVRVYAGTEHPHEAQKPTKLEF